MAASHHSPPRAPLPADAAPPTPAVAPAAAAPPPPIPTNPKLTRRTLLAATFAVPFSDRAATTLAAPLLPRHPELVSGSSSSPVGEVEDWMPDRVRHDEEAVSFAVTAWDRALARFHRAEAALAEVAHTEDKFILSACRAGSRRDVYDRHLLRFNAALKKLLRTPAPGAAALAAKLDLLVAHEMWELTGAERCLAAMRADAHRLAARSA